MRVRVKAASDKRPAVLADLLHSRRAAERGGLRDLACALEGGERVGARLREGAPLVHPADQLRPLGEGARLRRPLRPGQLLHDAGHAGGASPLSQNPLTCE